MSAEKQAAEAGRWLAQACADLKAARLLDKLTIPTRYPNGLPDLTPAEVYGPSDAAAVIGAAEKG